MHPNSGHVTGVILAYTCAKCAQVYIEEYTRQVSCSALTRDCKTGQVAI